MRSSSRAGFTLIELLIVVMAVGILAAVAYPTVSRSVASHSVNAVASVIAADVEAGFSLAARTRRPMVFTCDPVLRHCRVTDQSTGGLRYERRYDRSAGYALSSMTWAPTNAALPVVLGASGIATQGFTITITQGSSVKRVIALRSGLVRIN